jgi:Tol biopolymer transport system component
MATDVAGSAPVVEPVVDGRAAWARASVVLGGCALVVLGLVRMANLSTRLDGVPGAADVLRTETYGYTVLLAAMITSAVGLVLGFRGRSSRRRGSAILGSVLCVVAFLGSAFSTFGGIPYEPGISGLAWSPDSSRIVFVHTWAAADGEDGIWVVAADGSSEPTQLIVRGSAPVWSPDGTTIAYANESGDLWLMDADGQNGRRITRGDSPVWSPDGTQIAFGAPGGVWIVDAEGGNRHRITDGSDPAWSPDGTQIAFAAAKADGSEEVWIVDSDGQNRHRIADGSDPDWSPDGTQIVHVTNLSQRPWTKYWVINADGTGRTQLPGENWSQPRWTADGRLTAGCLEGLCVMDADGTNRQVLLAGDEDGALSNRVLSPDGTRVAYVTGPGIRSNIVVTTLDRTTETTLIH